VARLAAQWEAIEKKAKTASAPALLYSEPDLTIRVIRDVFNEDFSNLVVAGDEGWDTVDEYVRYVAPHLADRLARWHDDRDVFAAYRIDEQLAKALERKVWLPSGGSLVIDKTEAMTVIDVNTGKFTGQGGNLEETVTRNNLEAAEEIVRQLRLRDVGGIIVIDFIDMVLESNRDLVLRRLLECLARDRTKHQVAEVTSLGLVQMTRKRVGSGLLEVFSEPCECCNGRGLLVSLELPDRGSGSHRGRPDGRPAREGRQARTAKTAQRPEAGPEPASPAGPDDAMPVAAEGAGPAEAGPADAAPVEAGPDGAVAGQPAGPRRRRAATRGQGPPEPFADDGQLPGMPVPRTAGTADETAVEPETAGETAGGTGPAGDTSGPADAEQAGEVAPRAGERAEPDAPVYPEEPGGEPSQQAAAG
jgi:ribonuclease E